MITIYTDGSSRGNPGPGGWAAVLLVEKNGELKVIELGGREDHTTNNRMELIAIREALHYVEERKLEGNIALHTDSAYAMNGLMSWMYGWQKNGWKTGTGDAVLNQDIWEALLGLMVRTKHVRDIDIHKVEGHAGVLLNERADMIATACADGERILLFKGTHEHYEKMLDALVFDKKPISKAKKSSSSKKAFSYVSCVDGVVHVDATWGACEKRVKGKAGAKYKKVFSKEEEVELKKTFSK